jgi:hypothetical protein
MMRTSSSSVGRILSLVVVVVACAAWAAAASAQTRPAPRTFCNPLDLDYGLRQKRGGAVHRHGADPVVVLFKDRYWLFSTWDRPGYRVSDDLVNWSYIPFGPEVKLADDVYTAAAVAVVGDQLYFTEFGKANKRVALYRTSDPASGRWEKVTDLPPYADPCLFVDPPSGRVFMYYGLEKPVRGVELDRKTFAEVPGTATQLMPAQTKSIRDGWEVCTWDNSESSPGMRSNRSFASCREGSWMTYFGGRYYLQYASPGTTVPGYADGVLTGDSPLGPFTYSPFSPISRKASGFITSAGHSCLFQDRYGNWWRAVTMLIGARERMERRIGLFPAGFDADGVPYTRTDLGDFPLLLPDRARDALGEVSAGWWPLSCGAKATASSSLDGHAPEAAADEQVRTWWSAKTGDAGEWLQLDLGEPRELRAAQVNLAEQDVALVPREQDHPRFALSASADGKAWTTVLDRSDAKVASPHDYIEFPQPVRARYLKLVNVSAPGGGKFAVADLRAFGVAEGDKPDPVRQLAATRDPGDRRKVTLTWSPAAGAKAYLVRYGIAADKLYQHEFVRGGEKDRLTLYCLNHDPAYFFRIDAINDSGRTEGRAAAQVP